MKEVDKHAIGQWWKNFMKKFLLRRGKNEKNEFAYFQFIIISFCKC